MADIGQFGQSQNVGGLHVRYLPMTETAVLKWVLPAYSKLMTPGFS